MATPGRVRAIRKTQQAGRTARRKPHKEAAQGQAGSTAYPGVRALYAIVFTAFPEPAFTASEVLQRYRTRRQVEPVFKRFGSPAQLGRLPEYDDESAKAWPYGKLLSEIPCLGRCG